MAARAVPGVGGVAAQVALDVPGECRPVGRVGGRGDQWCVGHREVGQVTQQLQRIDELVECEAHDDQSEGLLGQARDAGVACVGVDRDPLGARVARQVGGAQGSIGADLEHRGGIGQACQQRLAQRGSAVLVGRRRQAGALHLDDDGAAASGRRRGRDGGGRLHHPVILAMPVRRVGQNSRGLAAHLRGVQDSRPRQGVRDARHAGLQGPAGGVGICLTRRMEEDGLKPPIRPDVAVLLRSSQFLSCRDGSRRRRQPQTTKPNGATR